ncbi:MAG: FlgD immunoglobulin-like domain containing protein, partial [Elusimicrobiota bacterium]
VALTTAPDTSDGRFASSAITFDPLLFTMTPTNILNSGTAVPFAFTGEIFGPGPAITFFQVGTTITATGVTVTDDLNAAGTLNPFGRGLGAYTAAYANAEGRTAYLVNAFTMDIAAGKVSIFDNLFRPLKGGSTQITTEFFGDGRVTIKVYTLSGGLVAVLADQELPAGTYVFSWNGRTGLGSTVASGVYLVSIQGPKIDTVQKVIVIK